MLRSGSPLLKLAGSSAAARARAIGRARASGATIGPVFGSALSGFSARLDARQLAAVRRDPEVAYVDPDRTVRADATRSPAPWGLDRGRC